MEKSSQSKYLIEQMQPDWLQTSFQQLAYNLGVRLIFGMLAGLAMAFYFATQVTTNLLSFTSIIIPSIISAIIFALLSGLVQGRLPGILCGLMYAILTSLMTWHLLPPDETGSHMILLSTLLINGVVFGLFLGIGLKNMNIQIVDTILWSYSRAFIFTRYGLLLGSVYVGIRLIFTNRYWRENGWQYMIYELLLFSLVSGIIGGLDKGKEIEKTTLPNQGIIRSARYSILLFITFFPIGMIGSIPYSENIRETISISFTVGLLAGLAGGQFSGLIVIKHLVLRLILWVNDYIPFNCASFLDYATERILLQKSGGGYIFYHRSLLEYFACLQETDV